MRQSISVQSLIVLAIAFPAAANARDRWTPEQANAWAKTQPWYVGCNYIPSSAINQLEMWQADSFDRAAIDRELGWAAGLGFNSVRVFLHHLTFEQDREGFLKRIDEFLALADKHKIGVVLVPFDSVWDPHPKLGKQRPPQLGLHNSGWVQCPGADDLTNRDRHALLEAYVRGVVSRFKDDRRVQAWDIWNEPDNLNNNSYGDKNLKREPPGKRELTLELLAKSFRWARDCDPTQPVTSGVWIGNWGDEQKLSPTERVQLEESDVITFHSYGKLDEIAKCVENLRRYKRPLICTEFMARPNGSTFDPVLGYLKEQNVGAHCWGFVAGKSNTIYPWDSWQKKYDKEPPVWFHDIFRVDGEAYRPAEVEYIRKVTGKSSG